MYDPSNNLQEGNNVTDQNNEELHLQVQDLQEDINQIRESNIKLFRATANEMNILKKENSNLASILLALKKNFDSMVPDFLEQRDKIREFEIWRMNMENNQIPNHRRNVQDNSEDINYDEFVKDEGENYGNERIHTDDEEDNEQRQANSNEEDENYSVTAPKSSTDEIYELTEHMHISAEIKSVRDESLLENESAVNDPIFNSSTSNDTIKEEPERLNSGNKGSMEFDLAQDNIIVNKSVEEEESIDKQSSKADLTKADTNKEDAMKFESTQKPIELSVSTDESESTQTEESKGKNEIEGKELADKEPTNDGSTDFESNMDGSAERDLIKDEAFESDLTQKDLKANESTSNHSEVENATSISIQKDPKETTAMEDLAAMDFKEKSQAKIPSQDSVENKNQETNPPQQVANSTTIPKPKQKYKVPIVLIKNKRRKLSSKSL